MCLVAYCLFGSMEVVSDVGYLCRSLEVLDVVSLLQLEGCCLTPAVGRMTDSWIGLVD